MATPLRRQRGATLVEALIGFLVLAVGVLGAARLQSWMRLNGDIAVQRSAAVQLAQQDLEQTRAFADLSAFQGIAAHQDTTKAPTTAFKLTREVATALEAPLKTTTVSVSWLDRSGSRQSIRLESRLSGLSPKYSAALALPPQDQVLAPRQHLPSGARAWRHGRSVFRPSARSPMAWVIDNASGMVTAQCSIDTALDITEADLTHCTAVTGRLLSGYIRFSLGAVPDAAQPNDAPLTLTVSLAEESSTHCAVEASATTERYLAYTCFVPEGAARQIRFTPEGWAFGDTASTFKACRYSKAPPTLARQNYLVIRGDTTCPGSLTQHNGASIATVQHQP